jgi:hypothetical protein
MPSNFSRLATRKKQTRLVLDLVEPSSSAANPCVTPVRIRYRIPGSSVKTFDLSPQCRGMETEDDVFASGEKYAVVIETPRKTEKSNDRSRFRPLISPVKLSQVNISDSDPDGKLFFINTILDIIFVFRTNSGRVLGQRSVLLKFTYPA